MSRDQRTPDDYAAALLHPDPDVAAEAWRHVLDNLDFSTLHAETITADNFHANRYVLTQWPLANNPKENTMPTEYESIHARGYMVEATLTPTELRVRGTNKASQLALHGPDAVSHDGERNHFTPPDVLVIPRDQIARVEHTAPKALGLVNGHLVVHTTAGKKYEIHYRKKTADQFAPLVAALSA
ncbi:hypothetical protein [Georgenia sp. MJ170]|uniref:hypothetical protein n=1 Tax=Georgenia sunbinii TaxID=3117728 RepID=UPI002F2611D0